MLHGKETRLEGAGRRRHGFVQVGKVLQHRRRFGMQPLLFRKVVERVERVDGPTPVGEREHISCGGGGVLVH